MYEQDMLFGISKVPFEIPHKISCPYIERYDFYTTLKLSELLDFRAHTCFWIVPPEPHIIDTILYTLPFFSVWPTLSLPSLHL